MRSIDSPIRVAILLNGFTSPLTHLIKSSFLNAINSAVPPSTKLKIEFFDPIIEQRYPDPSQHDLIVLSGGTADPMGSEPWVLKMQSFLRTTVSESPKPKIVGICWGHQTLNVTFGGVVGDREEGSEIGVTDLILTEAGTETLPFAEDRHLRMHEFHRREVKKPGRGFIEMAEGAQMFKNEANTIWTFQGHPELNAELASRMVEDTPAYMGVSEEKSQRLAKSVTRDHDGAEVWKRILEWIRE